MLAPTRTDGRESGPEDEVEVVVAPRGPFRIGSGASFGIEEASGRVEHLVPTRDTSAGDDVLWVVVDATGTEVHRGGRPKPELFDTDRIDTVEVIKGAASRYSGGEIRIQLKD